MIRRFCDTRQLVKTITVLGFMLLSGVVQAQFYDDPGLGQKPVASFPQDYKPLGVRAGSFMLHPGVQLAAEFNDNVFYTLRDEQSDTIYHIRPYISAQSTWSRHSLNVKLAADFGIYNDRNFLNYQDYFLTAEGRLDVKNRSYLSYGAQLLRLHEGRNNRGAQQGYEPTVYHLYGLNIGYDHTFNRLALGGLLTWKKLDYENAVSLVEGVIDNQDRNRDGFSWMLQAGYQFRSDMQAFVSYTGYDVNYQEQYDRNGYDRSGNGYSVKAGLNFTLTGKLNGDVNVGYYDRGYDDPLLPNTNGWGAGAGLQWTPTYLTTVYGRIDTSIQDTTYRNASGYLSTLYSLRVDHELTRFVQLNAFASFSNYDYQLIDGALLDTRDNDKYTRYGIGASWFINRHLFLNASYAHQKLKSNLPNDGYDANMIWLTLGIER